MLGYVSAVSGSLGERKKGGMKTRTSSAKTKDANVENAADKDAEEKLLREIRELRLLIERCEWSLDTLRFKDVERNIEQQGTNDRATSRFSRTPNVEARLRNELYRFAGLRCVKFRRDEFVFNFTSTNERQRDNTHALQIFVKNGKGNLGKWAMPMSIDMNHMLIKTPIDNLKNMTAFIKSCKHNIDCYVVRQEQFLSLKKSTSQTKHCLLQTNMGYTQISLELYGVHDLENDRYINLTIYLLYHSNEARPYKIEIDTVDNYWLSDETKQRLKACLKEFKMLDLQAAFDKILMENDSAFTWIREDDNESLLELNSTSNSEEEGFLTQLKEEDKNKSLRKVKKKRESKKRQRNIVKDTVSSEDSNDDNYLAKVPRTESSRQTLTRKKETKKITPTLRQREIDKKLIEDVTPMNKSKTRLKQTKLNFQTNRTKNLDDVNKMPLSKVETRTNPDDKKQKTAKLFTSTPLHHDLDKLASSSNLDIENITIIELLPKQTGNKLNDSRDSNRPKNKNTLEIMSPKLRSGIKDSARKKNQRIVRSTHK